MPELYQMVVAGFIRHVLTGVFGALVLRGVYTNNDATQIVVGLTGALAMFGWSAYQKVKTSATVKDLIGTIEGRLVGEAKRFAGGK